jgi:dihydrodipicolinate synthase/N-acetylneuraminate lyase
MFAPEGIFVAMVTPFDKEGRVAEDVLRRMVDFYVEKGVTGLFPISSVGEFIHMSVEDRRRVIKVVVEQAAGRVAVTPGVGDSCAGNVINHARFAKECGCPAAIVCGPFYLHPSQAVVRQHYETVAAAVDMPFILYNIPIFATGIAEQTVEQLSRLPNVVGMKDSSGDSIYMANVIDRVRLAGSDFNYLTGLDQVLYPSLALGARGLMGGLTGVVPELTVAIYRAFQRGEHDRARQLQYAILALGREINTLDFPVGFKLALQTRGFEMGPPKQPLDPEQVQDCEDCYPRMKGLVEEAVRAAAVV